jgi:hypothetical protein
MECLFDRKRTRAVTKAVSPGFVILVVDTTKVVGYTVGQLADYLAMLSLTVAQSPDHCDPLPSILDLMSSSCGTREKPTAITAGDCRYASFRCVSAPRRKKSMPHFPFARRGPAGAWLNSGGSGASGSLLSVVGGRCSGFCRAP